MASASPHFMSSMLDLMLLQEISTYMNFAEKEMLTKGILGGRLRHLKLFMNHRSRLWFHLVQIEVHNECRLW
jgi:hypothetical protein